MLLVRPTVTLSPERAGAVLRPVQDNQVGTNGGPTSSSLTTKFDDSDQDRPTNDQSNDQCPFEEDGALQGCHGTVSEHMARVQSGCTDYNSSTTTTARNDDEWEPVRMRGRAPVGQTSESGEEKTPAHPEGAARSDRRHGIEQQYHEATAAAAAAIRDHRDAQQQQPTGRVMDGATITQRTGGDAPSTREQTREIITHTTSSHLWMPNRADRDGVTSLCSDMLLRTEPSLAHW